MQLVFGGTRNIGRCGLAKASKFAGATYPDDRRYPAEVWGKHNKGPDTWPYGGHADSCTQLSIPKWPTNLDLEALMFFVSAQHLDN